MDDLVWRVGWVSAPLDFVPREVYSWQNRFDDARRRFRSLYASRDQLTCLREVLADLRPNSKALADFADLFGPSQHLLAGEVTWTFRTRRVLARARLRIVDGELIDIDDVALRQRLERRHAALLRREGMDHLDIGDVRSTARRVTQTVAGSLYDDGAAGMFFRSRLDDHLCIALFEGRADLAPAGIPLPLTEPLPALLQVCSEFNLVLRVMDK